MPKSILWFMVISSLAFALLNVLVKNLGNFNVYQIIFFRSIGTLVFTIPFLVRNRISMYGNKKMLLVLRGLVGVTSMTLFFLALKHLSSGSATVIRYISPIFATFFALFLFKEKIKHVQWLFFIIAFFGVLILKGFDAETANIGILYALGSALFSGLVFIVIRKIGDHDHPVVIVNYFMMITLLLGGILSINNWTNPAAHEWILLLSLGIFGYFGQVYMTKALQQSETNQVAPLKYIEVIFTMLIGVFWLDEIYSLWSLLGIFLIITGLTLNILCARRS